MTDDVYNRSITTGELQLAGCWQKFIHYGFTCYLLFMPFMVIVYHLVAYFNNIPDDLVYEEYWVLFLPPALAAIAYLIQKKRLKFKVIKTTLSDQQLQAILNDVAKEAKWVDIMLAAKKFTAKAPRRSFWGGWGEQITVLLHDNNVFIKSICDSDQRASMSSWGRNGENENLIVDKITEAEEKQ